MLNLSRKEKAGEFSQKIKSDLLKIYLPFYGDTAIIKTKVILSEKGEAENEDRF